MNPMIPQSRRNLSSVIVNHNSITVLVKDSCQKAITNKIGFIWDANIMNRYFLYHDVIPSSKTSDKDEIFLFPWFLFFVIICPFIIYYIIINFHPNPLFQSRVS